jgi:GDP-4-dehydro-6-deoxy-D-mannose reductase
VGRHLLRALEAPAVPFEGDVTRAEEVGEALRESSPSAIVHLAAASSVAASWDAGSAVWSTNVLGTVALLDAVREHAPAARVLIVSSGEVYGEMSRPARESDPPAPVSPYAASKLAAEVAAGRAVRADGLDVVVARPFQHVGPGQDPRFAVGSWTRQIAELELVGGGELEVGNLSVERDLLDVRDVCRAYVALLRPDVRAGTYNVASGRTVTLRTVVDTLLDLSKVPITVRESAARRRRSDIRKVVGDASLLRSATGWGPEIRLEQTLAEALEVARAEARAKMSA